MHTAASVGPINLNTLIDCNSETGSVHSGSLAKGPSCTIQCTLVIIICHLLSALHIQWIPHFMFHDLKYSFI